MLISIIVLYAIAQHCQQKYICTQAFNVWMRIVKIPGWFWFFSNGSISMHKGRQKMMQWQLEDYAIRR